MAAFAGGTSQHSNGGYIKFTAGPLRNKLAHVEIAEARLGRELREDETVHHIDGDTKNPHWRNLKVIDVKIHNAVSRRQHWYLKRKLSQEEAAWRAYFDITGEEPI